MNWIVQFIEKFGAAGVALLMLLENVLPPIPSELIMPLAGFNAAREGSGFWASVVAGSAGSLAGTGFWYVLAKRVREDKFKAFLGQHGRWLALDGDDLDRVKGWFEKHGTTAVFLCRLIPGLRTLISVPAGFSHMSLFSFLAYSAAGTFLWSLGLAFLGQQLGENYHQVADYLGPVSWIVTGVMICIYLWRVIRWKKPSRL
jgi:membrane protein DedA with SNARE-associated domain